LPPRLLPPTVSARLERPSAIAPPRLASETTSSSRGRAASLATGLLYVVAAWLPLQYLFTRTLRLLPLPFIWLDDAALVLAAALALLAAAVGGTGRLRSPLDRPVAACAAAGIASAAWNGVSPLHLALALRGPLQPVLAFYALWWLCPPRRHLVGLGSVSLAFALAQVPVAVAQFAATWAAPSRDLVFGTFWIGASNSMAYYLLFFALPLLGAAAASSDRKALAAAAALGVPIALSGSRGAILLLPLLALVAAWPPARAFSTHVRLPGRGWRIGVRGAWALIPVASSLLLALAAFHALKPPPDGAEVAGELSPRRLWIEAWDHERGMGRLWYARWMAERVAAGGPASVALGVGPSRFSSSAGAWLRAPLLEEATRGGHSPIVPGQLVATASEYGLAGLAAFGWLSLAGIAAARRGWRAAPDGAAGGLRRGVYAASLFLVLGTPLENVWELPHVATVAWAGIAWCVLSADARTGVQRPA
jgi:hypothetical protein